MIYGLGDYIEARDSKDKEKLLIIKEQFELFSDYGNLCLENARQRVYEADEDDRFNAEKLEQGEAAMEQLEIFCKMKYKMPLEDYFNVFWGKWKKEIDSIKKLKEELDEQSKAE